MAFFPDLTERISAMRDLVGDVAQADQLPAAITALDDETVVALLRQATEVVQAAEQVSLVTAGVIARRSQRSRGHSGLAQSQGHRSSTSMIQEITGTSRTDASRQERVGGSLLASEDWRAADDDRPDSDDRNTSGDDSQANLGNDDAASEWAAGSDAHAPLGEREWRWDAPLREALFRRMITNQQHDAIRRGLGEPPAPDGALDAVIVSFREAWALAAEQLVIEAQHRTLEELRAAARTIRDQLDPEGAEERFRQTHEARAFRLWNDSDGRHHASATLDDDGYLWLKTIMDSAMRPRRGGPRFVDAEEKARAADLADDPRTNDQLAYDLILDVLRAGALADAEIVFGTRQAGVRLIQKIDASGSAQGRALTEDGLFAMPSTAVAQHICDTGSVRVTIDGCGHPLDVGREQRLFTPKQRIALAIRDGGCRWKNCDRPASYCEAHHIDPYSEGGRTDIDRGILLCRFHHMELHHGNWRIIREENGGFILRHRSGEEHQLKPRLALSYAWTGIDPPPKRFRRAA